MIDTNDSIESVAVQAQFVLSVLARALDGGEPIRDEGQPYLELNYDESQGCLMIVADLDRALKAIVEAASAVEVRLKEAVR